MDGRADGQMNGWMMDAWMSGRMNKRMGRWMLDEVGLRVGSSNLGIWFKEAPERVIKSKPCGANCLGLNPSAQHPRHMALGDPSLPVLLKCNM